MIETYDVYISKSASRRRPAYHRPDREHASLQVTTRCNRLQLMDCEAMPEIDAVLHHEPCLRCFPVRGRRGRILNLTVVVGVPDG